MTGDFSKLNMVHDISPILVKMPNGQCSVARKQGTVKLSTSINLYAVLFVLGLTCNLISIARLINDLLCTVTFTPKLCVIQDHTLRMPIGVGEQRRGVYLFKEASPKGAAAHQLVTSKIWHQ